LLTKSSGYILNYTGDVMCFNCQAQKSDASSRGGRIYCDFVRVGRWDGIIETYKCELIPRVDSSCSYEPKSLTCCKIILYLLGFPCLHAACKK
jgi:hypothetical protein